MQGKQRFFLRSSIVAVLLVTLTVAFWNVSGRNTTPAHAENNGVATTPFMGWSTYSFDGGYPTQSNIEAQANVEASKLESFGYNYVLLDDHYYLNPGTTVDQYGRWEVNSAQFPNGIAAVASYVHSLGLKFGIYVTPGIPVAAVNQNTPIEGTSYHAKDAADTSKYQNNYGGFGNVMYYLNYSTASQDFLNSWADEYASWGVDFLKIDAVGDWNQQDVEDWSNAIRQSGRPMVFDLSNTLDRSNINFWRTYSNAWRIEGDVQCYSACSTLVDWSTVSARFNDAPAWAPLAGPGGWNDLDSLNVADGAKDGLTNDERQTYMTLWSIEAAPLYAGDDLTTMDSYGLSLLTNSEVIAVDQRGKAAVPVSQSSSQQVWYTNNGDGSYTVALFNLGGSTATVTANWSSLGFSGAASVRDLWSHTNLGTFNNSFSASLNTHASRLFTVVPGGGTPTPIPTPGGGGGSSYEAASSANTLAGGAVVAACSVCSGGEKVGYVGDGGTLQFNGVQASSAGTYTLTIYYIDGDTGRTAQMSVNGGAATTVTFHGTNDSNWNFVQSLTVPVQLNAGNNTILFSNASAPAPDFDQITIAPTSNPTPTPTPTSNPTPTPTVGTTPTPTPTATPSSGGTCKVNYSVQSQWTGGFTSNIIITNTSTTALTSWSLQFSFPNGQQVTEGWDGTFSQQGSQVTVQNLSYNGSLAASGGSTSLGFNGSWTASNANPTSFTLNGTMCSTS